MNSVSVLNCKSLTELFIKFLFLSSFPISIDRTDDFAIIFFQFYGRNYIVDKIYCKYFY